MPTSAACACSPTDALILALTQQTLAMGRLTDAINRQAASTEALIQAMAEAEGVDIEDLPNSGQYLDGSPKR